MESSGQTNSIEKDANIEYLVKVYKEVTGQDRSGPTSVKDYVDEIRGYLENVIACMPGNVYWANMNDIYLGCNDNAAKFLNLKSRKEIVNMTHKDFEKTASWNVGHTASWQKDDLEVIATGRPKLNVEEKPILSADGKEVYYLTSRVPLFDIENKVIGVVGISIDVTTKKRAERLEIEKESAQQASRVTKEWAGGLISQILAISSAIITNSDEVHKLCTDSNDSTSAERILLFIDKINHSVRNINNAISLSVFKLNKSLSAQDQINAKEICVTSIAPCISSVLKEFAFQNNGRDVMRWDSFANDNFTCNVDAFLIKNMLFSLIEDALVITRKANNGVICINSLAGQAYNLLIFKISGSEISAKDTDVLVQAYDINSKNKASPSLLLCKTIMQSYNGDVSYSTEEGREITITFSFPHVSNNSLGRY